MSIVVSEGGDGCLSMDSNDISMPSGMFGSVSSKISWHVNGTPSFCKFAYSSLCDDAESFGIAIGVVCIERRCCNKFSLQKFSNNYKYWRRSYRFLNASLQQNHNTFPLPLIWNLTGGKNSEMISELNSRMLCTRDMCLRINDGLATTKLHSSHFILN